MDPAYRKSREARTAAAEERNKNAAKKMKTARPAAKKTDTPTE